MDLLGGNGSLVKGLAHDHTLHTNFFQGDQMIYISYQMVFAEGLAIGEDLGLDLDTMLEVWSASAAGHASPCRYRYCRW